MASATLSVTVNGGIPPFSIQVSLFKDGNPVDQFTQTSSFTHLFSDLAPGSNYDITVGGFNPAGGNTSLNIAGSGIVLTADSSPNPSMESGIGYHVDFNFNV